MGGGVCAKMVMYYMKISIQLKGGGESYSLLFFGFLISLGSKNSILDIFQQPFRVDFENIHFSLFGETRLSCFNVKTNFFISRYFSWAMLFE